jgi:hypothetical protein
MIIITTQLCYVFRSDSFERKYESRIMGVWNARTDMVMIVEAMTAKTHQYIESLQNQTDGIFSYHPPSPPSPLLIPLGAVKNFFAFPTISLQLDLSIERRYI